MGMIWRRQQLPRTSTVYSQCPGKNRKIGNDGGDDVQNGVAIDNTIANRKESRTGGTVKTKSAITQPQHNIQSSCHQAASRRN